VKTAGFIAMNGVFVAVGYTVSAMAITWVIAKASASKGTKS